MNLWECEEASLQEDSPGEIFSSCMRRGLQHYEFERDSISAQRIFHFCLNAILFFLTVLALNLGGRISKYITVTHIDQLNLVFRCQVDYLEQIHDSMLEMWHF